MTSERNTPYSELRVERMLEIMSISTRSSALPDRGPRTIPSAAAPGDPAHVRPGEGGRVRRLAPGLAMCAVAVLASSGVHRVAGAVPALTAALLLGVASANIGILPTAARPGLRFAGSRLMRAGIVLLGLRIALSDILGLGWQTIAMTIAVLVTTFYGTQWLGRRMGLSSRISLLVASGFAICGASAVAAVNGVLGSPSGDREAERETATAIALVTLCGTLAIAVMPAAGHLLGLSPYDLGRWIGASVHDVGQVVATATVAGSAALIPAVGVKLVRVAMLAPVTAVTALRVRRGTEAAGRRHPPVLPLFLLGFLAMVVIRSTGEIPQAVLDGASTVKDLLFAAAMFGLGSAVRLRVLVRTGHRALLLGLTSWVLVAGVSYAGVMITR
jgi:uncharacterized integral membrane protein (TIGR00698 family)